MVEKGPRNHRNPDEKKKERKRKETLVKPESNLTREEIEMESLLFLDLEGFWKTKMENASNGSSRHDADTAISVFHPSIDEGYLTLFDVLPINRSLFSIIHFTARYCAEIREVYGPNNTNRIFFFSMMNVFRILGYWIRRYEIFIIYILYKHEISKLRIRPSNGVLNLVIFAISKRTFHLGFCKSNSTNEIYYSF